MNEVNERVRVNELLIRLLLIRLLRRLIRRRLIRSYTRKGVNDHELSPNQAALAADEGEMSKNTKVNTHFEPEMAQNRPFQQGHGLWPCGDMLLEG